MLPEAGQVHVRHDRQLQMEEVPQEPRRDSLRQKAGYKCKCAEGHCAYKGKCYPRTDTTGTCSIRDCKASRGPTSCRHGRCLCKNGYVAVKGGKCSPRTDTTGTCSIRDCKASRG